MKAFKNAMALAGVLGIFAVGHLAAQVSPDSTQIAELYKLQAAWHRAASVHDPINGDSAEVINQRIRDMLSLWAEDGVLAPITPSGTQYYIGRGDLDTNCPPPSGDPNNEGTICTFFKYVSGAFQPQNKFVSLAPSYSTTFEVHGNTAAVYFECWYFSVDDAIAPVLALKSHPTAEGYADKIGGQWLFAFIGGPPAGVPIP